MEPLRPLNYNYINTSTPVSGTASGVILRLYTMRTQLPPFHTLQMTGDAIEGPTDKIMHCLEDFRNVGTCAVIKCVGS